MEKKNIMGAGSFNLKKFIVLCFKSWKVFVAFVVGFAILGLLWTVVKPQKMEVFSQLMLKEDSGGSSMMMAGQIARSFSLGDMFGGSTSTDNETFVLKSHTVFLETARQMDLNSIVFTRRLGILWQPVFTNAPLRITAAPTVADTISRTLTFRLNRLDNDHFDVKVIAKRKTIASANDQTLPMSIGTPYGNFVISATEAFAKCESPSFKLTFCSYDAAANAFEKLVKVYVPDRKSDFIDLSFVTDDPAFGKSLLNHIIANYDDISNVYKIDRSAQSLKLVDDRLATLANELHDSEHALEQFKLDNKLTDVEVDAQYLMTKTGSLEASLLEAQTNYEVLKMTRDFINNPANNYSLIPDLLVTSGTNTGENSGSLISQYNQLILERMQLLTSAKANNATIKILDQQIDALRENIITSVNRVYDNASVVLRDLKSEEGKNKSRIGELPTIERQYLVLKRDNLLQEQIYLFLLQQREELNMSLASKSLPAQVIDPPYVLEDQPGLSRLMTLALAVLLGGLAACAYVFFKKMRHYPITSSSELSTSLRTPSMQALAREEDVVGGVALAGDSANAEAFRKLRSDVQFALKGCGGKSVAVTSVNDGEGKTYVAVNLAAAMAMSGKRTLLIDTSLRDPQVAALLGISDVSDVLADYVKGNATRPKINTVSVGSGASIDVIASKASFANPSDLVASDRFSAMVADLSADYDYVVIDASRIRDYSDIYYVTDVADVTLVVCRSGIINAEDVETINRLYEDGRLKRIATIQNAFK